jgi:hypothetical protein
LGVAVVGLLLEALLLVFELLPLLVLMLALAPLLEVPLLAPAVRLPWAADSGC